MKPPCTEKPTIYGVTLIATAVPEMDNERDFARVSVSHGFCLLFAETKSREATRSRCCEVVFFARVFGLSVIDWLAGNHRGCLHAGQ